MHACLRRLLSVYRSFVPSRYGLDPTSKTAISLKDAKARGFTACKVCHPPE
jgi:hypothetical protein